MKAHLNDTLIRESMWNPIISGGMAGIAAWLPCYPQDVVKSVIQSSEKRINLTEAVQKIYRTSGWRGFFKGFTPTIIRAFPANAATFLGYELVMSAFKSE